MERAKEMYVGFVFQGKATSYRTGAHPYGRTKEEATEKKGYLFLSSEHTRSLKQRRSYPLYLLLPKM